VASITTACADDSKIATRHLLQKVTYRDDGVGDRGHVKYAYNAQGQVIWTEDQATNVLENVYDTAGRETARKVTTLASGFDGAEMPSLMLSNAKQFCNH